MIISSLPMCAVRADGLNFASLEASVQGERVSRNFAFWGFSEDEMRRPTLNALPYGSERTSRKADKAKFAFLGFSEGHFRRAGL